jgi:hypothetical protein
MIKVYRYAMKGRKRSNKFFCKREFHAMAQRIMANNKGKAALLPLIIPD